MVITDTRNSCQTPTRKGMKFKDLALRILNRSHSSGGIQDLRRMNDIAKVT